MAKEAQLRLRADVRVYRAEDRNRSINRLKRDFRAIAIAAKLNSERLSAQDKLHPDGEKLISISDVPLDYPKFLDELGMANPKVRRLGFRLLKIWDRIDNALFMSLLENSLFDSQGHLKSRNIGGLLQDFHQSLLSEIRRLRAEHNLYIPLEKAKWMLSKNGNQDGGQGKPD